MKSTLIAIGMVILSLLLTSSGADQKINIINFGPTIGTEVEVTGGKSIPKGYNKIGYDLDTRGQLYLVNLYRKCSGDLCSDHVSADDKDWAKWKKNFQALGITLEDRSLVHTGFNLKRNEPDLWKVDGTKVVKVADGSKFFYVLSSGTKTNDVDAATFAFTPPSGVSFRLGTYGTNLVPMIPTAHAKLPIGRFLVPLEIGTEQ